MTAALKFRSAFHSPFFGGAGTSSLVPFPYPVALDGRPYKVVLDKDQIGVWGAKFKSNALPLLRSQADQSNTPGEQSISPENFWRRSQDNWISGSGQFMQDRKTSIETRFYQSKGINPWTAYQTSLLNQTTLKRASTNSGLQVVVNGTGVYLLDGAAVFYSSDGMATWNAVTAFTGTPASMCSDGTTLYLSTSTAIYTVTGTTATSYVTSAGNAIGFVKSRLMLAVGPAIYNLTVAGALPTFLMNKATGFTWVGFAGGQTQIYAAGFSGDKSLIYRIGILADATALSAPIIAGELPDGEIVRSINAYLGFVVIGSDLGIRFCNVNSDGSLTIGALIPTTAPVYASEGQDRFIWYGLSNFDALSTGLGRMDMTTFTATLTPAYASDLMATGQGAVRSVKTFNKMRIFTVDGLGLFAEALSTPVVSGTLTTGWISYGISDPKVALFLGVKHEPLNGTISASIQTDGGTSTFVGTSLTPRTAAPNNYFQTNQSRGLQYQLVFTLTPTANISPILTRWTLLSYPAPSRSTQYIVPIVLKPVLDLDGNEYPCDVVGEKNRLIGLLKTQNVVTYQEGNDLHQVVMSDWQWLPELFSVNGDFNGIFLATLNEISG